MDEKKRKRNKEKVETPTEETSTNKREQKNQCNLVPAFEKCSGKHFLNFFLI